MLGAFRYHVACNSGRQRRKLTESCHSMGRKVSLFCRHKGSLWESRFTTKFCQSLHNLVFCCDNLSPESVTRLKRTKHEVYLVESSRYSIGIRCTVRHRLLQSRKWYILIKYYFVQLFPLQRDFPVSQNEILYLLLANLR